MDQGRIPNAQKNTEQKNGGKFLENDFSEQGKEE